MEKILKDSVENQSSTLKEVWETMQRNHFPILATSTKDIWNRRYKMLQMLEHLPMNLITPFKVSEWVIYWVGHFSTDDYQNSGRCHAGRCNLNNELTVGVHF